MPRNRDTGGSFLSSANLLKPKRPPTPDERIAIREVHELAAGLQMGIVSLDEIRSATSGKQRWLATRFTEPKDVAFEPLMRMLDALIADEGRFQTKHGDFEPGDFFDGEAKIIREDGHELVVFPALCPWERKPEPERGIEGVRRPPVYRQPHQRGPVYGSFSVKPPAAMKPYKPEWWEVDNDVPVPITAKDGVPF